MISISSLLFISFIGENSICSSNNYDDNNFYHFPLTNKLSSIHSNQHFIDVIGPHEFWIHERVKNNDDVGQIRYYATDEFNPSFSIEGIYNTTFLINNSSGEISIYDNSSIQPNMTYNVSVQIGDEWANNMTITVVIHVSSENNTIYIDDSAPDGGDGSFENPYNKLDEAIGSWNYLPGFVYLLKRNTLVYDTIYIHNANGSKNDPIVIGAYGYGKKPVIDATYAASDAIQIGKYFANTTDATKYVFIQNIEVRNSPRYGIQNGAYGGHHHITFLDVYVHHCGSTGIWLWSTNQHDPCDLYISVINCESSFNDGSGTKWYAGGMRIYNFIAHDNNGNGIRLINSAGKICQGALVYNNQISGIQLRSSDTQVTFFKSYNNYYGIEIWYNDTVEIIRENITICKGDTFNNTINGVRIWGLLKNISVEQINGYKNGYHGLCILSRPENILIENSSFYDNGETGIKIMKRNDIIGGIYSKNISIFYNQIYNNSHGIYVSYAFNNTIIGNNLMENSNTGIYQESGASSFMYYNDFLSNINYGIYIASSDTEPYESRIFYNNFINNSCNGFDEDENVWDYNYPHGGNFWDDYEGIDENNDGIGDTPYNITGGNNQDRYPLTQLISEYDPPLVFVNAAYLLLQPGFNETIFNSIQAAIEKVADQGFAIVEKGIYAEHILINKSLHLLGEKKDSTIINGTGNSDVIEIISDQVIIQNFTVNDASFLHAGITVYSSNNTFIDNIFSNNSGYGLKLASSSFNTIRKNSFFNNDYGIGLFSSSNHNSIDTNYLSGNIDGIIQYDSIYTIIKWNNISNNGNGIWFTNSSHTNITDNYIAENDQVGVWFTSGSTNNIITRNTIKNNSNVGIQTGGSSTNNLFYHNNLLFNNINARDQYSNNWDKGNISSGNYWSDYSGSDTNHDGFGDTPYNITGGGNMDFYPFMKENGWIQIDINQSIQNRGFPIRHAVDGDWGAGQNFTQNKDILSYIKIYIRKFGSPEFDLTVELRENSINGAIIDSITIPQENVPSTWTWIKLDFTDVTVTTGIDYFIKCPPAPSEISTSFGYEWGYAFGNQYDDGSFWFTRDGGNLWRDLPTMYEFVFRTYGYN